MRAGSLVGRTVLDMNISTDRVPPTNIKCVSENGTVECILTDIATGKRVANFTIHEDLVDALPHLIDIYLR